MLSKIQCIQLNTSEEGCEARTAYWRINKLTDGHLSTIEAIYHFIRQLSNHPASPKSLVIKRLDDLLFLFHVQRKIVADAMLSRLMGQTSL